MKSFLQILVIVLLFTGCKLGDDNLPGYTEEGRSTFGCVINREKFHPLLRQSGEGLVYNDLWGFRISVNQYKKSFVSDVYLKIIVNDYPIEEGRIYPLRAFSEEEGSAYGQLHYYAFTMREDGERVWRQVICRTSEVNLGELLITKYDSDKRFIAGRFWFDCENVSEQLKFEIRHGRFDLKY